MYLTPTIACCLCLCIRSNFAFINIFLISFINLKAERILIFFCFCIVDVLELNADIVFLPFVCVFVAF